MNKLTLDDLHSLETYARLRKDFRAEVMAHKAHRKLTIGDHVTLFFEDRLTMHYQVQEMLRAERIFEQAGIQDELDAYNPLIPDGGNLKATMMIEYPEPQDRQRALAKLLGIEDRVWVQVDGQSRSMAIADEDMSRANDTKTSAVHFLRFELSDGAREGLRLGAGLQAGIDHPEYQAAVTVPETMRESLIADLQ